MERAESPIGEAQRLLAQSRIDLLDLIEALEQPLDEKAAADAPSAGPDSPIENAMRLLADSRSQLLALLADDPSAH